MAFKVDVMAFKIDWTSGQDQEEESQAGVFMTYQEWMRSWKVLEEAREDHVCPAEEFSTCEQCERAVQAHLRLQRHIEGIMRTLICYHDALDEITHHVVQEVTFPREQGLQQALLKALSLLDKAKS